jgi:hypothetical protein
MALVVLAMVVEPARADVALCPSFPPPPSDAQALRQAPFAFEGVAVGGREVDDPQRGIELVSPLTFRVSRWLKRGSASVVHLPGGGEGIHVWDGRYARLTHGVLARYSKRLGRRFPGEIVARAGQSWRIFATNENGVNFTCTDLLGSHPIQPSTSPPPPRSTRRSNRPPPDASWPLVWGMALAGAAGIAGLAWLVRKRGRGNGRERPGV